MEIPRLLKRIRVWLALFIIGLVVSGLTAFPLQRETTLLLQWLTIQTLDPYVPFALVKWVAHVQQGLAESYRLCPFLAYGTDWLAFAHLVIAIAFWGPLTDPVKNRWVIEFGMIACLLVLPLALIAGPLRGIPLFWQGVDCSFGLLGVIPLWISHRLTLRLELLQTIDQAVAQVD